MGLRENNKQDKRERLSRAAHALFSEQGFDATTIRQIAERAGIGVGTIFLYARDKQGLLFLLFSEAVLAVEREAFASLPGLDSAPEPARAAPRQSRSADQHRDGEPLLLRQLLHVFSAYYRYYMTDRALARLFVKELLFLDSTPPASATKVAEASDGEKHVALTMNFIGRLAGLVGQAQARGELREDFDPLVATLNFFASYFLTLVGLLDPVHGRGLDAELATERLRDSLQLQIAGLAKVAPATTRPSRRRLGSGSGSGSGLGRRPARRT